MLTTNRNNNALTILLLLLMTVVVPIYSLTQQQIPFFLNHHKPILDRENTLTLKSIYHHASANGPIPKLFRKTQVGTNETMMKVNQHQDATYILKSQLSTMERPVSSNTQELLYQLDNRQANQYVRYSNQDFTTNGLESTIGLVPDVTHRGSVTALAMMTYNAYLDININSTEWYDLGAPWHLNSSFGWESDGIRGHIFANEDDSLIVISIKGTSAGLFTGGPTGEKDKLNDNMLFSCCCARISRAWTPVCDCYKGNEYKCENNCLQKKIQENELYYDAAMDIFFDVYKQYKNSTIWLTGHSLGGAIASMVGITFGIPTVTFEIPGDKLASSRLHLPHGPGAKLPVWHFGHTADPIFVGVCTGPTSTCWYGGFAMESRCHTGKVCVWDTVKNNGWRVDIRSHRVRDVIETILKNPKEFPLPECVEETDCQDCGLWEYYDERDGPFSSTTATRITTEIPASTRTTATATIKGLPNDPWPTTTRF